MYRLRKLLVSFVNTLIFLYFIYYVVPLATMFKVEWLGLIIIILTLRTRVISWMFCACFHLRDGTVTYSRILYKDRIYEYRNYTPLDKIKISFLTKFPEVMFWTDYKHGVLPHGLNMYCHPKAWWKGTYQSTMLQLTFGYCLFMGYYENYYNEMLLVWAISFVLGMIISPIDIGTKLEKWHHKLFIFKMNIFDVFYYLSLGFTRRGGRYPIRIIFSIICLIVALLIYFGYMSIIIDFTTEMGEKLWELLLQILPGELGTKLS